MRDINGRAIAASIRDEVIAEAEQLRGNGTVPKLAVVVPTRDESTAWYVRSIERTANRVGVECHTVHLDNPHTADIKSALDSLSADDSVHGIICQTPLPGDLTLAEAGEHITVAKDIDGANPASLGRLAAGLPTYPPATAAAVAEILRRDEVTLSGTETVIIGRSMVVGKPAAMLLLADNATVTVCHSRTTDLPEVCARADVLIAAVGRAEMVTGDYVKPGAVVIDVGTNPTADGGLAGDVDAESVSDKAAALTPVPGGVGPVTTMLLMRHTVRAAAT